MFSASSEGETLPPSSSPLAPVPVRSFPRPSRRHPEGLQHEQDSQPDRGGGGPLPGQQHGDPAHHVPAGGPLPDTHTLL